MKTIEDHIEFDKQKIDDPTVSSAARTEKPFVSKHIADMLAMIDNVIDASDMLEKLENRKDGDSGFFGTFFNTDLPQ